MIYSKIEGGLTVLKKIQCRLLKRFNTGAAALLRPVAVLINQKQPLAAVLQNRCSLKKCSIQRKSSVVESLFNISSRVVIDLTTE